MKILQRRLVRVAAAAVAVVGLSAVLGAPTGASAAMVDNRAMGLTSRGPPALVDNGGHEIR